MPPPPECIDAFATWDPAAEDAEWELFDFLNFARQSGFACANSPGMPPPPGAPMPPIQMRPELACAARLHSRDMVEKGYFDHFEGSDGPEARMRQAGYTTFRVASETIGGDPFFPGSTVTYDSLAAVFAGGGSECENLVDSRFDVVGIGVYGGVFTLDFAGP